MCEQPRGPRGNSFLFGRIPAVYNPAMIRLLVFLCFAPVASVAIAAELSPAATGWIGLALPGSAAIAEGNYGRGILEATTEIGTFVGGMALAPLGPFTIDGNTQVPQWGPGTGPNAGPIAGALSGAMLQQFGLKFYMYNTFYHYQKAVMGVPGWETGGNDKLQPIYRGGAGDVLSAPFRWKYLSNPFVFVPVLVGSAYLFYEYSRTPLQRSAYIGTRGEDYLYGIHQIGVVPLGSAFGEEPLFRGFLQREFHQYTGSEWLAILGQSVLFCAIHPADARASAFFSGLYYGWMTDHFDGDLGSAIAMHFWGDVVNGLILTLQYLGAEGKEVPLSPPVSMSLSFHF